MSKDLIQALEAAAKVFYSIGFKSHAEEVREALSRHRSSVESVELPTCDGGVELDCGQAQGGGREVMYVDGYTASTVRSLIAAAVEREREECAQVCDGQIERWTDDRARYCASECAAAIRSRGEKQ